MSETIQEMLSKIWPQWKLVEYEPIGIGGFSKVYKAKHEEKLVDTTYAAIKVMETPSSDDVQAMINEMTNKR